MLAYKNKATQAVLSTTDTVAFFLYRAACLSSVKQQLFCGDCEKP